MQVKKCRHVILTRLFTDFNFPFQFDSLASQQMQQIQQMRMLQSLGQYSQLGLSSQFQPGFGQNYSDHHQNQSQVMNDHDYGDKLGDQHMKPVSSSRIRGFNWNETLF